MKATIDSKSKIITFTGSGTRDEFLELYEMFSSLSGDNWTISFVTEASTVSPSWITNPADVYRNPFNVENTGTGTPLIVPPYTVTCDVTSDNINYTSITTN